MPGERFHVVLEDDDGREERVAVEVGMEGFHIFRGATLLRKYPLASITRWSSRGGSLVLFTRSPSDVEDRVVTLRGDEHTVRSVLDTLTSACMQMAELLESGRAAGAGAPAGAGVEAANALNALLRRSRRPAAAAAPAADEVEFWRAPEKAGWLQSQGEHLRTWRRRWFVLKQGYLFRFACPDVTPRSKPRGVVDLSAVTDVADGGPATGRPASIKLSTASGASVLYLADSETAQVEWVSALEGAVQRIVRAAAGVDDELPAPARPPPARRAGGGGGSLREQLERGYAAGGDRRPHRNVVQVIGYGDAAAAGGGGGYGGGGGGYGGGAPSAPAGYVSIDYGTQVAGAHVLGGGGGGGGYNPPPQQQYQGGGGWGAAPPLQQPPAANGGYGAYGGGYAVPPAEQQHYGGGGGYGDAAPAYGGGTLMDAATAPPPAPPPAPAASPWQAHRTADGRQYYYNAASGATQWDPPAA